MRDLTEDEITAAARPYRPELHGRRRSAPRSAVEHQAADRYRQLSRPAPPPQPAGARPAHPHQRAHPQGPEEDGRRARPPTGRQEEVAASLTSAVGRGISAAEPRLVSKDDRRQRGEARQRPRRGSSERWPHGQGAHPRHVQQHDRDDHRPAGQRPGLGSGRHGRLQGLAQEHALRRPDGGAGGDRRRQRSGAAGGRHVRQGPRPRPRGRHPRHPGPGCRCARSAM